MAIRSFLLASAFSFSITAVGLPAIVRAEDAPADVETARHRFVGVVNGTSVFVRSAPREDAYPTMKLEKGQKVTVVGIKFKWLKILPPEGSFAYVPKAYVNLRNDGKVGRASREVFAKVGSTLNQLKTAPMAKVDEGQDVEILGSQDEYYKVKPPEGSFVYINESFVDPLEALPPTEEKPEPIAKTDKPKQGGDPISPKPAPERIAQGPTTKPSGSELAKNDGPSVDPTGVAPATQPAETVAAADAQILFSRLEADFKSANEKDITDQPIDGLLNGYKELLKLDSLTPRMRDIGNIRVSTLELRSTAKAEFLAMRDQQLQAADKQKSLIAEQQEIQQRIKEKQVLFYAAVGTLRASSIQRGTGTLYRLTDPSTGRTVAYVRTADTKFATMLGQFVGVKGTISTDSSLNLKMIDQPTALEAVDPAKVNDSVSAQIVPPSLVPKIPTARASD